VIHIKKEDRKRILFITDSLNCTTGVGNISREIVYATANHFNWLVVGGFAKTEKHGQVFNLSDVINKDRNFVDSNVLEIHYNGYGDRNLFQQIANTEKIDAILLMSDPRSHLEFFNNINLFKNIPICWYNIWDALPTPYFNKPYYDSCDTIINISKLTDNIVKEVLHDVIDTKLIKYVPHGFDENKFYKIDTNHSEYPELNKFKDLVQDGKKYKFTFLFNSVNIPRKNIPVLLEAYKMFVDTNGNKDDFNLILHTQCDQTVKAMEGLFGKNHNYNVTILEQRFDERMMRYLYNMCDVLVLPSCQEGFGMSLGEAIMCEKMVIAPLHGGMSDQMNFGKCDWAEPIFEFNSVLTSNEVVPYIYSNYIDKKDLHKAMTKLFKLSQVDRERFGTNGRNFFLNNGLRSIDMTESIGTILNQSIDNFVPKINCNLTKI
jgi:glycosyltransferase involved in cell wall biosynthesis